MKSTIDWNEIVPKLPKKMRDDLYLQAVTLLSEEEPVHVPSRRTKGNGKFPYQHKNRRYWRDHTDGASLWRSDRRYRINKEAGGKAFRAGTNVAVAWAELLKLNKVEVSYAEMMAVAKLYNKHNTGSLVSNLWSRKAVDVVNS